MGSVLKDWVMELGLRHQGVLLTVVRGCDTAPKDDPSKLFTRCIRGVILNCHCGDAVKAVSSFIEKVTDDELVHRFNAFRKNLDHYPHHYVMHVVHAVQIIGYTYPSDDVTRAIWCRFYETLCRGLHVPPESPEMMDRRLNADEETFGKLQK